MAGLLQIPMQIIEKNTALIQAAGGGVSKLRSLFGPGGLEFEANMRLLDSKVCTYVCTYVFVSTH